MKAWKNYLKSMLPEAVLDYQLFQGRNHFVLGLPTWQEDADFILDWIDKH
jgi:hypothetical protein